MLMMMLLQQLCGCFHAHDDGGAGELRLLLVISTLQLLLLLLLLLHQLRHLLLLLWLVLVMARHCCRVPFAGGSWRNDLKGDACSSCRRLCLYPWSLQLLLATRGR